jgi:hypothetical protein
MLINIIRFIIRLIKSEKIIFTEDFIIGKDYIVEVKSSDGKIYELIVNKTKKDWTYEYYEVYYNNTKVKIPVDIQYGYGLRNELIDYVNTLRYEELKRESVPVREEIERLKTINKDING